MRIILDTMGSDNGSYEFVKGAVLAAEDLDIDLVLVGNEKELCAHLSKEDPQGKYRKNISVIHASEVVDMHDDPLKVMKEKPDSSMTVALRTLSEGKGDALVSAGNTGALLTQATLIVKRIRGIRRAALAPVIPSATGIAVLIDSGANAECTPEYLYQFALMGSYYAEHALGVKTPKVGLLNNGTEEHKGDEVHREANRILTEAGQRGEINYIGNIEGRDGPLGKADVIVADGFSGNVYLKTMEGVGMFFARELKNMFMASFKGKIAGLMVKGDVAAFKKKIDYNDAGGAPLLGVKKPVIKAHGSSDQLAFRNAVRQAMEAAKTDFSAELEEGLLALTEKETPDD
ncbi:MAG: phosphate acyltransferase PlsX [Oscillospiraceae bacterium]|nr:phosphate acyltransferase PlsX [Oscillospiraceae bacterium]